MKEELQKQISSRYKPVRRMSIETDYLKEPSWSGERYVYANWVQRNVNEKKRYDALVTIIFEDNTGIKIRLEPEDYLSKLYHHEKKSFFGDEFFGKDFRDYDYGKMLKTILNVLQGKEKDNPTFETLDLLGSLAPSQVTE